MTWWRRKRPAAPKPRAQTPPTVGEIRSREQKNARNRAVEASRPGARDLSDLDREVKMNAARVLVEESGWGKRNVARAIGVKVGTVNSWIKHNWPETSQPNRGPQRLDHRAFIVAAVAAEMSNAEIATELGISVAYAAARISAFRAEGLPIPLRKGD